jgi:Domain of unknown function (DUF4214)
MTSLSDAQTAIASAIQSAYGRAATTQETTYWVNNFTAGEALSTILAAIAADGVKGVSSIPSGASALPTPGATASPPATTVDNTTFVNFLYVLFFKRLPSPSEVTFYLNAMAAGTTQTQVFAFFTASTENQVVAITLTGTATDVANRETIRDATSISDGTAGFVDDAVRDVTNVGANDKAFEWTHLDQLNSAAAAGTENVATYSQANGTGTGEVWGSVSQVTQSGDVDAIGIEIDVKKGAGTADGIGLDIVNYGNETAEIQGGDGEIIWRDRTYDGRSGRTLSCIKSTTGGGFQIVVRGSVAGNWP